MPQHLTGIVTARKSNRQFSRIDFHDLIGIRLIEACISIYLIEIINIKEVVWRLIFYDIICTEYLSD